MLASALVRRESVPELDEDESLDDSLLESFVDDSPLEDSFDVDEPEESDSRSLRRPLALVPWSFL